MGAFSDPRIRDAVRGFNKRVVNPAMRHLAGRRYWYASLIRHTGRRSGRSYATPVVAVPIPAGLLIPLPYGVGVDWLRNVLAAGTATIVSHGRLYAVTDPQIVDATTAEPLLPARRRREFRRFGIDRYVRFTLA